MKLFAWPILLAPLFGQTPAPPTTPQTTLTMAVRIAQLMESTAVAVPDLARASEPVRQLSSASVSGLRTNARNAAIAYRFLNQARAYVALSDSFPASEIPPVAIQQFGELREDLARFQQRFEADLAAQGQNAAQADADPNNMRRYAEANSKLLPLGTLPRVVFLGDSITDSWRLNEYFNGRDFVNRGISGQTSGQMLGRFMQDVVSVHPKVVVILAGTNDIARGIPAYAVEDTLGMMGDIAKAHGVRPVFASILPVSDYHAAEDPRFEMTKTRPIAVIQQVNRWMKEYCQKEGFVFLDYYTAMADSKGQMPADLADDGLHPNSKGYRIMSPLALDAVTKALGSANAPPSEIQSRRRFSLPGGGKKSDSPTP
jgi:lysophospholipase L1-like esterase